MPKLVLNHKLKNTSQQQVKNTLLSPQAWHYLFSDTFEIKSALTQSKPLAEGMKVSLKIKRFGLLVPHVFLLEKVEDGFLSYRQTQGVFKKWHHEIDIKESKSQVLVKEKLEYEMPFGILGHISHDLFFRQDIQETLKMRLQKIEEPAE